LAFRAMSTSRAARLVDIARKANTDVRVVWPGAPVMAHPGLVLARPVFNAALAEALPLLPGYRVVDFWLVRARPTRRYADFDCPPPPLPPPNPP